ncbi:MAG: cation:proton antiporter [Flavobacteriales bacterium]|nr:cation:proton antiporter [Flavobacteriales bacterium]
MLHNDLLLVISLLFAVSLLTLLGPKLRIAQPILLVLGGLAIALVPGVPHVRLEPELIFLIFLPPLLYEAAWFTSWREFWRWKRSILLLAFGLVFFTSLIVGLFTSWLIPGFTLALGFLLGGIISPPDAVAATSVLKGLRIPKRATTILEGESLVNDASSLIVFRFALAAVVSGQFVMVEALEQFVWLVLGGIVIGLVIAHIVYFLHRWLPTTASIDTAMTLMSPYLMYIAAEHFHCSGVMAVVTGGLFLSFRAHDFLDYKSRLQATHVWSTLIAVRYLWMFPAAHIPRLLFPSIRRNEISPGWRAPILISWAGMRGVVSLAAALAIPQTLPSGEAFPHRETILVITFTVILITLVGQGLTLPWVVRKLKLGELDQQRPHEEQELELRGRLVRAVIDHVAAHPEQDERMQRVHQHFLSLEDNYLRSLENLRNEAEAAVPQSDDSNRLFQRDLIAVQRRALATARQEKAFDFEVLRKMEGMLDLEEARMNG